MSASPPEKVLITGGHELGGVESFAQALLVGFRQCGVPGEVIPPPAALRRWRELRSARVLKVLSTTAVFASPLGRRCICMAHGVPVAAYQGWKRMMLIAASFRLANRSSGAQLVAVSEYTASHLEAVFNTRVDAVILNPVKPLYLEPLPANPTKRDYITFLGRLTPAKGLANLLPVVRILLDETPALKMAIIGDGPQKPVLMKLVAGDSRFEFLGNLDDLATRDVLRRTRLFVSGNKVEGLGITYLEALSQGCAVAMPAGGGGVEIALDQLGRRVHLLPLSLAPEPTLAALRTAIQCQPEPLDMSAWSAEAVARQYLQVDARFDAEGRCRPNPDGAQGPGEI